MSLGKKKESTKWQLAGKHKGLEGEGQPFKEGRQGVALDKNDQEKNKTLPGLPSEGEKPKGDLSY